MPPPLAAFVAVESAPDDEEDVVYNAVLVGIVLAEVYAGRVEVGEDLGREVPKSTVIGP